MSLDQNLFTLTLTPNADDASVTDLIDGSGVVHYHKQRVAGNVYTMNVYDPMSGSLLATATAPSATNKVKIIELHNPTSTVELKYVGSISFRWAFKWEEHEFEWKREECYILRKPDPPVLVAVTKEPAGRIKTSTVQILDYNLNRFDINDRKGLEIVLLTALLTFSDTSDAYHSPSPTTETQPSPPPTYSANPFSRMRREGSANSPVLPGAPAPAPPPKPAPKTGLARIVELHAMQRDVVNEVRIEDEGSVGDWAQFCTNMLKDDAMLFITIQSASAEMVPKVLQVVEEAKRMRHKADEDELHQYVVYDAASSRKGPKRINLDDPAKDKYAPPEALSVHLSKIAMPELQPNHVSTPVKNGKPAKVRKEDKKDDGKKGKEKEDKKGKGKEKEKDEGKKGKGKEKEKEKDDRPGRSKIQKPIAGTSAPPSHARIGSHQVHPGQPTPSPSQLNNPVIYTAPPPPGFPYHQHPPPPAARPRPPPSGGLAPGPPAQRPSSWFGPPSASGPAPYPIYGMPMPAPPGPPGPPPMNVYTRPPPPPFARPQSMSFQGPPPPPLGQPAPGGQKPASSVSGLIDMISRFRV